MKRTAIFGTAAVLLAAACTTQTEQAESPSQDGQPTMYAIADSVSYTERAPGSSMATVWGNPDQGAHGVFVRFTPGFDAGTHTHPNDVNLVVIRGAYLYRDDAGEKRVGLGQFLHIRGGHPHWSGGDAREGALFYHHGNERFDLVPTS